ncbi:MAG: hypothetical protein LIR50_08135 [Bacillota bacterium]|nr:hypothetical protein [Bacillota bacterium]
MNTRKEIIEILKPMKSLLLENNGPVSIFAAGNDSDKIKITSLSVDKDFITVTTGKYLFKRKFRISKNEL